MHIRPQTFNAVKKAGFTIEVLETATGSKHIVEGINSDGDGWYKDADGIAVRFELHTAQCGCEDKPYIIIDESMTALRAGMLSANFMLDYANLQKAALCTRYNTDSNVRKGDYVVPRVIDDICLGEMDIVYVVRVDEPKLSAHGTPSSDIIYFDGLVIAQGEVRTVQLEAWRYRPVDPERINDVAYIRSLFLTTAEFAEAL
jgi:hypothetical protein